MGYEAYLKGLLGPLGVYDMENGSSAAELAALGAGLDGAAGALSELDGECTAGTAAGYGLALYEAILPERPVFRNTAMRRAALCALLSIDGICFTAEALNRTLAGCGLPAAVQETEAADTVRVTFPGSKGIPDDAADIEERVAAILPCHLACGFVFVFLTWAELESAFASWNALESAGLTWKGLESYGSI